MTSFRGVLHFASGTGQSARAYCFSRDGAGKFSLAADPYVDFDTSQGYIEINVGARYYLQFAVDTAATNFGQSNFGTLASTGGESCTGGILEIKDPSGARRLFTVYSGYGFYNGTDKLFFALNAYPPRSA